MKIRIKKPKVKLLTLFILIPVLILTLAVMTQPQRMLQFAQEMYTSPPLFGCLQVGEGNASTCASKLGRAITQSLRLHGRPIQHQDVYYGDSITGALDFLNVGDLPISLSYVGLVGQSQSEKNYIVDFFPSAAQSSLEPGQKVSVGKASYRFSSPDPNGEWIVTSDIQDVDGNKAISEDIKTKFTVNATCTALRTKELTEKDKSNLQAFCAKNPKGKLCSSRQYCEIFKGENCTQANVSDETPKWQCDEYVYLPKNEQDLLEEFCKVYPDSDACEHFCERTLGTSLCPDKYLFIETITGKVVSFFHPRVLYVKNPDGFKFAYSPNYPTDRVKVTDNAQTLGITSSGGVKLAQAGVTCAGAGQSASGDLGCCPGLKPDLAAGGVCISATAAPAPTPKSQCPIGQTLLMGGRCSGAATPAPGAGVAPPPPPPPPPCPAPQKRLQNGSCGICDAGDIQCEANMIKELSANCPKGPRGEAGVFVPGEGCRTLPPPPPATPVNGPPPACGIPGQPKCNLEKNNQAPDPLRGRIADPTTCDPAGKPVPPATQCTSLTIPETAVQGDFGYAKHCKSSRQDENPNDDPPGAPQFACCANSLELREGCCGQACTVWSQKALPNGTIQYRDGLGRVCTNAPKADDPVLKTNTCGPQTRTNPGAQRAKVIPKNLQGTSGSNPPPGFIPQSQQPVVNDPAPPVNPPVVPPPDPNAPVDCNYECKVDELCVEKNCSQRKFRESATPGTEPVFCGPREGFGFQICVEPEFPLCINNKCAAKLEKSAQPVPLPQVNPQQQACIDGALSVREQCLGRCKQPSTGICSVSDTKACTDIANNRVASCKLQFP